MLNRRGFAGVVLAGMGGFLFPQKVKANKNQWWEEKEFIFEGVPGTEYLWPRDRLIYLEEPDANQEGRMSTVLVPTFSLLIVSSLEHQIQSAVESQKETDGDKYCGSHIHLIRVQGKPNEVGILMCPKRYHPVVDCWADSDIREKQSLERLKGSKPAKQKVRKAFSPRRKNRAISADMEGRWFQHES